MAAPATASIAPEINPPGRWATRNTRPPTVPIASVSTNWRVWVRLGRASATHLGIWLTPPYGKSARGEQMRWHDRCNAAQIEVSRGRGRPILLREEDGIDRRRHY